MIGLFLAAAVAVAAPAPRPVWCQAGYVCIPTREAADLTVRLADLQAEVTAYKSIKASRWGWIVGCGPSASLQVHDGTTDLAGTLSCTVGLGVKIGR